MSHASGERNTCSGCLGWAYTGYVLDKDLVPEGRRYTEDTKELLSLIDVLVDGPYVAELYDITLKFKGSSNQRVIDCRKYNETGVIEELM